MHLNLIMIGALIGPIASGAQVVISGQNERSDSSWQRKKGIVRQRPILTKAVGMAYGDNGPLFRKLLGRAQADNGLCFRA